MSVSHVEKQVGLGQVLGTHGTEGKLVKTRGAFSVMALLYASEALMVVSLISFRCRVTGWNVAGMGSVTLATHSCGK